MDGLRFDDAMRSWETGSRRTALRLVTGSVLMALLAPLGRDLAMAKKKKKCKHGKKRCLGQCIPKADCCIDADCPAGSGQTCQAGRCACPAGQGKSGGVCGTPPPPTCFLTDVPCPGGNGDCCNGHCVADGAGGSVCACANAGDACLTIADCCFG
ncbi:MAG TPA: hypothetical protein VFQ80_00615, partial [Thermomicrobiales bacterium]|nr:hypothetical protein [Thermomicrobiales bacterium]